MSREDLLTDLSDTALVAAAIDETGLQDFGDEWFRTPLRVLLESLEQDADLTAMGRTAARGQVLGALRTRLAPTTPQPSPTPPASQGQPVSPFAAIHHSSGPEECVLMLAYSFASYQWPATHNVTRYAAWLNHADLTPAYGFTKRVVQTRLVVQGMAARERHEERFVDVAYADLVDDPVGSVRTIYERFGDVLAGEGEERLGAYATANPQHKFGVHSYSLGQFFLHPDDVDRRFAVYRERFGVEP